MGFSLGDFIQYEKVELKKIILSETNFFYSKDPTCRLFIPKIIDKIKFFWDNFYHANFCLCMLGKNI